MILQCSCCLNNIDTAKLSEIPAFCPTCGAVLIVNGIARSDDYCRGCGRHIQKGATSCLSCGASVTNTSLNRNKKGSPPKDKNANMKLYAEWMKYSDLPAENVKQITGSEIDSAPHNFASSTISDSPVYSESSASSYNAAPFVGTTKHWRTADKIGAGVSSFLKNTPLLFSLLLNVILVVILIIMLRN